MFCEFVIFDDDCYKHSYIHHTIYSGIRDLFINELVHKNGLKIKKNENEIVTFIVFLL